jgi:hypothetical protein
VRECDISNDIEVKNAFKILFLFENILKYFFKKFLRLKPWESTKNPLIWYFLKLNIFLKHFQTQLQTQKQIAS